MERNEAQRRDDTVRYLLDLDLESGDRYCNDSIGFPIYNYNCYKCNRHMTWPAPELYARCVRCEIKNHKIENLVSFIWQKWSNFYGGI